MCWDKLTSVVLVIVGALWRQVDHATKITMPWKELQSGPAPAEKTVLLDYLSPILPNGLLLAIRNKHWAVVLATLGHLLLMATTIFSTGLLNLEPSTVTRTLQDFRVRGQFQAPDITDRRNFLGVGAAPAELYYGINVQNLQYPLGTSESVVVPKLDLPEGYTASTKYTSQTDGVTVDLDCEILDIGNGTETSMPWISILASFWIANVTTPDCNITGVLLAEGPDHGYYQQPNATQNYQSQFRVYPCNYNQSFAGHSDNFTSVQLSPIYDPNADQRVFLSVTDLHFAKENSSLNQPEYIYINKITAALCKPNYSLSKFNVSNSDAISGAAQSIQSASVDNENKTISGFPNGALSLAVEQSTLNFDLGPGFFDYVLTTPVSTFFQFMSLKNGNTSVGEFMDPDLLIKTARSVYQGLGTQVMHQVTLQGGGGAVAGEVVITEYRLKAKALSAGFICGIMAALILISAAVAWLRPRRVAPHAPGSLASLSTVLASSPIFSNTLLGLDTAKDESIKARLSSTMFQSVAAAGPDPSFSIQPTQQDNHVTATHSAPTEGQTISWWRPMAATPWFIGLAIGLSLLVIAMLEVIQHFSDVNQGFVAITSETSSLVLATYIPAAVALGIAGMYSAFEWTMALFAPYDVLRRGKAAASRSVNMNVVGAMLPHAFFVSLKTRHFALGLALLANLIGGFLTIVVSGLYSPLPVSITESATVQQSDAFNLTAATLFRSDKQAGAITSLMEFINLQYTPWTYDNLAFHHLNQTSYMVENSTAEAPFSVVVPATRARLNCTSVPNEARKVTFVDASQDTGTLGSNPGGVDIGSPIKGRILIGYGTNLSAVQWCEKQPKMPGADGVWMQYFSVPMAASSLAYIGKAGVMKWDDEAVISDGFVDTGPGADLVTNRDDLLTTENGCPTFAVTFGTVQNYGKMKGNKGQYTFAQDLATIVCHQNVEEVMTNITFQLPKFTIDPNTPPVPDESTRKLLKTKAGSERHQFAVNAWLNELQDIDIKRQIDGPNNTNYENNHIDNFLHAMVFGKDGQNYQNLIGEKNVGNLYEVVNTMYGKYMAQAFSYNMRTNSSQDDTPFPSFEGVLTTTGTSRLRQNKGPKIALQAMLGAMALIALASRLLLRTTKQVLPHDPCSIAGKATLLAGSSLATRLAIPLGSEWLNARDRNRLPVFASGVFGMRWREEGHQQDMGWQQSEQYEGAGVRRRYGVDLDTPS